MLTDWGKVDSPEGAIFAVAVERIDGADGKAILSVNEFDGREQKRLLELKKSIISTKTLNKSFSPTANVVAEF
ncbi:MAG: hypothetical protein A6F72_07100 [Cycloclasticus sp. symbiont of Poecilosclerida sp. N]|nr:MAG: hypothetical protein A6F72_07100 [Cycloclasticus sp. symbiont of Poecilosclerida sp. N]